MRLNNMREPINPLEAGRAPHSFACKAWFLGPKAENQQVFEGLLLDAFRDYCYWRRNFHPEDQPYVQVLDRLNPDFLQYQESLRDQLFEMLSQLKQSMPFFSPRYLGHMAKDILTPGLLGYIAAMFYNQNNITRESATVTTGFEAEAMQGLAQMLGYDPQRSWGHLCSGGTLANIEALWTARNLVLFPYQLALAREHASPDLRRQIKVFLKSQSFDLDPQELRTSESLALYQGIQNLTETCLELKALLSDCSVTTLGLLGFYQACAKTVLGAPPTLRVAYSQNAHYSLQKSLGLLGLGTSSALLIPLDDQLRLDHHALADRIDTLDAQDKLLAVVGVYGSTEEGALDDFDALASLRDQTPGRFWLHADACYGGYALSLNAADRKQDTSASLHSFLVEQSPQASSWDLEQCKRWRRISQALSDCDSIALDPHKLGYLPYPAGTILYRDQRVRELIHCEAPYLNSHQQKSENYWETDYPGHYTLEGSRPGATSAAVWLAQRTIPLNREGHGLLVAKTLAGTAYLKSILETRIPEHLPGMACRFLVEKPDLNLLCYTFVGSWQGQKLSLARINQTLSEVYKRLLSREDSQTHDFVVSMTRLQVGVYTQDQLNRYWQRLSANQATGSILPFSEQSTDFSKAPSHDTQISLLRTVVMDPFLPEALTRSNAQYAEPLAEVFVRTLAEQIKLSLNKA